MHSPYLPVHASTLRVLALLLHFGPAYHVVTRCAQQKYITKNLINELILGKDIYLKLLNYSLFAMVISLKMNFPEKYRISTPLMMENPVRSPMVPPIADNMSTNFAALSLVILSNVGVSE